MKKDNHDGKKGEEETCLVVISNKGAVVLCNHFPDMSADARDGAGEGSEMVSTTGMQERKIWGKVRCPSCLVRVPSYT